MKICSAILRKTKNGSRILSKSDRTRAKRLNFGINRFTCHKQENFGIKFATILWSFWKQRNRKIWNNQYKPATITIQQAFQYLSEWQQACFHRTSTISSHLDQYNSTWQKPSHGRIKCNIDAALFQQQLCFGIGLCLKNHNGSFLQAQNMATSNSKPDWGKSIGSNPISDFVEGSKLPEHWFWAWQQGGGRWLRQS